MVNYIRHLESVFDQFSTDQRLTSSHVSLYYSLFHLWNLSKFQNPISICRSELMKVSKIGSANTYTRCLKQLDERGYIQYLPSFNPLRGSLVNLYSFDNSSDKGTDKGSGKGSDNSTVIAVRPSINSLNNTNTKTTKPKKEKTQFSSPSIDEVKAFFLELKSSEDQAEKFHNHFESNGWLVGGKAKMKDWKAAVRNWVKRSAEFSNTSSTKERLNTNQNKDYSIPL